MGREGGKSYEEGGRLVGSGGREGGVSYGEGSR